MSVVRSVIAGTTSARRRIQVREHGAQNVVMRVYGNVVIVNAVTVNKGHRRERAVSGDFSYTRVYVKRDGRWQAVLSQYTRPSTP